MEKDLFLIDLDRLEEHWQEQPELMRRWGERYANMKLRHDKAVVDLERLYAKKDTTIRQNPADYFQGKPTETAITNLIKTDPEYIEKQNEVLHLRGQVEILKAIVNALEHRKTALENLVKLHGQQYFALPKVKQIDIRELNKNLAREKIARKMKK